MSQVDYQTVFEIGLRSFPWGQLLHPVLFIVLGLSLFRFSGGKEILKVFGLCAAAFGTLGFLVLAAVLVPDFVEHRRPYLGGESSLAQGTVQDFNPMPTLGPAIESFSVQGIQFSYNVLDSTPCFHNAPAHKGPVRTGLDVRVYYKPGCIQRVDIQR